MTIINPDSLRHLHRLHCQRAELNARLERGPKQIQAAQVNVDRQEQLVNETKEITKRAKMACDERQLQLKTNESRISDLKTKLNVANSNKEYQALKEQIAADEMANSVLSDEILEMFEKIDEHESEVANCQQNLTKGREELDKLTRRVSDEKNTLESDLARVQDELRRVESALPAEFKSEYDRVVHSKGDEALAPLDGESCGSCYFTITPQMINEIMLNRPVFCQSCGCLLYLPEDD